MHIENFTSGTLIVRTEVAKLFNHIYNENLGISTEVQVGFDSSMLGNPCRLIAVANGMIYLDRIGKNVCSSSNKRELPLYNFAEGWDFFTVPEGLTMEYFETKLI